MATIAVMIVNFFVSLTRGMKLFGPIMLRAYRKFTASFLYLNQDSPTYNL